MNSSNQYFLKMFHNNLVGMILTDEEHVIVDVNDHLLELTDMESTDVIGKTGIELGILNETFVKEIWQQLLVNGRVSGQELSFISKNNKIVDVLFSTEKLELENKTCWLTTLVDISKRKETEKELSDVYARITDGVVAFDSNWNYTYMNNSAGVMMERDPVQMIGKNVWIEFPHLAGSDIEQAYFKAMEKQEVITLEQYFAPYDIWYLHMIYPSPNALSVFFKDISSKKINEQKIEESELRFRTLTRNAPVGIFETDAKGLTTYVNETWMQFTGMQFEEALGEGWLNAVHPDDKKKLITGWYNKSEKSETSVSEYRLIDKKGTEIWVNGNAVPVIDDSGTVTGYIGTISNVSSIKKSEQVLQERTEQLKELSTHLQNIREEERMNIAREIHDELGQQLTGLKMDIAWLMKKAGQDDPAVKAKFVDTLSLVDGTVKSIRRIATELRPSIIDDLGLNAALEWLVSEFSERLNIDIQFKNDFDDKNIRPDISIGLFRILQESLTNIAKHANANKVLITVKKIDEAVHLSVADDGVGFDNNGGQRQRSFGLLGIRERTYMLQGEYEIFTEPGEGAKIKVSIPLR